MTSTNAATETAILTTYKATKSYHDEGTIRLDMPAGQSLVMTHEEYRAWLEHEEATTIL